jgi:hypothetical protein
MEERLGRRLCGVNGVFPNVKTCLPLTKINKLRFLRIFGLLA